MTETSGVVFPLADDVHVHNESPIAIGVALESLDASTLLSAIGIISIRIQYYTC